MPIDTSQVRSLAGQWKVLSRTGGRAVGLIVRSTTRSAAEDARRNAAVLTGNLRRSITGRTRGLRGVVQATDPAAEPNEYGTAFMDAQPFIGPAAESGSRRFLADANRFLDRAGNLLR